MLAAACCVVMIGCHEPLYHDLDEPSANRMVVALHEVGVDARKVAMRQGGFTVEIPTGSTPIAVQALDRRGLPRPQIEGFAATYPGDRLVPSPYEERALFQHATAQEVRRSLLTIDGVVDAHVNLVVPSPAHRGRPEGEPPKASVVIQRHADADDSAVTHDELRRLVAHGVADLSEHNVNVLVTHTEKARELPALDLVRVGPLTVPAPQKRLTQLVLAALLSGILLLGLLLVTVVRGGRRV